MSKKDQNEEKLESTPESSTKEDPPVSPEESGLESGVVPSPRGGLSLSRRLASGALSAVAAGRTSPTLGTLRKLMLPLGVLLFFGILFGLFAEILRPFILALVIVYLMAPLVNRVSRNPEEEKRGLPRWLAVIMVYVTFLGIVTTALFIFIPKVAAELVNLGETLPKEVQTFRQDKLPEVNAKLQRALREYLPQKAEDSEAQKADASVLAASQSVEKARRSSEQRGRAVAEAQKRVALSRSVTFTERLEGAPGFQETIFLANYDPKVQLELAKLSELPYGGGRWIRPASSQRPSFRMRPAKGGGFDFFLNDSALELEKVTEGTWRIRTPSDPLVPWRTAGGKKKSGEVRIQEALDLERGLDSLIANVAKSSNARIASLVVFVQDLFAAAIAAFVAMILTLMVAAFMTIDLDAVMGFFRKLVPVDYREDYDTLLGEVDRGLSGVVRGQLMICLINGILTYIGLFFLDIKFSLLLAIVAGVLSLIPIFGTILSTIPIVLFGLMNGFMTGVFALLWILGIHFVEANILNPKIIGTSAHIHPVIVIFALLAGESAFGLFGALLAVPTASILLTLFMFFVMRTPEGEEAGKKLHDETVL